MINSTPAPALSFPPNPKPWWQSRTIWFNALSIVAGLGSIPFTGTNAPAAIAVASGLANVVLRAITTQPVTTTSTTV